MTRDHAGTTSGWGLTEAAMGKVKMSGRLSSSMTENGLRGSRGRVGGQEGKDAAASAAAEAAAARSAAAAARAAAARSAAAAALALSRARVSFRNTFVAGDDARRLLRELAAESPFLFSPQRERSWQ